MRPLAKLLRWTAGWLQRVAGALERPAAERLPCASHADALIAAARDRVIARHY